MPKVFNKNHVKIQNKCIAMIVKDKSEIKPVLPNNSNESVDTSGAPLVVDLFAGGGGFYEGFIRAGCKLICCIEIDKSACDTLKTRAIYHALKNKGKLNKYKDYVLNKISKEDLVDKFELQRDRDSIMCKEISENTYVDLIDKIKNRLAGRQLDIIVGGPPCQAYSYIGRSRDKQNMENDTRNYLYKYYIEFLKALKPKAFIFENVPGLKTAGDGRHLANMLKAMKNIGYMTDYDIINTVDFGVPQNRKRIILFGWKNDSGIKTYPCFHKIKRTYLVSDFLKDLPAIDAGDQIAFKKYKSRNILLESLDIIDPKFGILFDHVARKHNSRDLEIYKLAVILKNQGHNLKYNQLPKKLRTHKNTTGFLDRFKVVDSSSLGSHTVVAHISKDGHYYIHPDQKQNRSLSVREAARLQTFPDDYKFEGSLSSKFQQIGNAVPPMLAEIIAKTIIKDLKT